ncbi:MAG: hypothetical protein IPK83_10390 [Planctomycetes bacterium]|nr:hypothetical protein [Planctomycetota bacterium]
MSIANSNRGVGGTDDGVSKCGRARFGISRLLCAALGIFCFLGGCGVLPEETTTLDVVFDRTGTLQDDGLYTPMTTTDEVRIGDSVGNMEARGFISISLNALPANANVTKALLRFRAIAAAGNPFDDIVLLKLDHVDVVSGIDATDFIATPIENSIATIDSLPTNAKRDVSIDITSQLNADRAAGRPISSFRLDFRQAPTVDGQADAVFIDASDDDGGPRPSVVVTLTE